MKTTTPGQARASTWVRRLNNWLDRHPVTLEEAAQERQTDPRMVPLLELAQAPDDIQVSSEQEQNELLMSSAGRLMRHNADHHSGHLIV